MLFASQNVLGSSDISLDRTSLAKPSSWRVAVIQQDNEQVSENRTAP
jgi:hypothetical protein